MNLTHSLITLPLLLVLILPSSGRAADSEYPPLDVMVGSMIMCGFRGAELPPEDPFLKLVANGHVGHVILFDKDVTTGTPRNIISHRQVRQLVQTLKQAAARPMLIAIDQEGGIVSRLKPQYGFVDLPSAADMSEGKPELTRSWARKTGMEMRRLGINV
ncbi:MAG: glycoside hydrolase family 3 protein, partial [Desulfovibrio sp.]|nr:glycoside hydrolase family 3 protein [Desulfovibrio sp.]